jgi:RES domain-containing protein
MILYRITLKQYAKSLYAPGVPGRWNRRGELVIYASENIAVAALENMAHRMGQGGLGADFACMQIQVPEAAAIEEVQPDMLPRDWGLPSSYTITQPIGSAWYRANERLLLKVPAATCAGQYNYLINSQHKDFRSVEVIGTTPFMFDPRFKSIDEALVRFKKK